MKRFLTFSAMIFFIGSICACKKKKKTEVESSTETPSLPVDNSQLALKTGNYWIYDNYQTVDGVTSSNNTTDSCFIAKDTIIHGHTFSKYVRISSFDSNSITYLRDSLSYLVNSAGSIIVSFEDFTNIFDKSYSINYPQGDTIYKVERKMIEKDLVINVPAGRFITSDAAVIHIPYLNTPGLDTSYQHSRYTKNLGLVFTSQRFSITQNLFGKRLIRYHLN